MEPKILCPQVIHNHLDCTILRTAKNPVIRLDIEQTSGTVNLLRVYETRIVSVTVNALANRLSLRGLSHFHLSLFLMPLYNALPVPKVEKYFWDRKSSIFKDLRFSQFETRFVAL
jgi:hypothetical protein